MSRILHVDLSTGYRGGQRQLLLLVQEQQRQGLDVQALCRSSQLRDRLGPAIAGAPTLWSVRRALRGAAVAHAHESRAHGLLATLGAQALVVHRRIDDPPRRRLTTRYKYQSGMFVCVSDAISQVLARSGVPQERRATVHSGVPIPSPQPQATRSGPLRALCLGALVPHKGHEDLLIALARTPTTLRLDFVGDGPLRRSLERLAGADGTRFLGDPHGELPPFADYDVLIHPSRSEGLGTAVLDAQAAGLPVLATSAGGLPESVAPSGWLVPPSDPGALADAVAALAALPRAEISRRGAEARAWTASRFTVSRMERAIAEVYRQVESAA